MTVDLPDNVARRAEERAAEPGISVSEYLARAVESESRGPAWKDKPWMAGFGELRHLSDDFRMIEREVEEAFERIEPENWE